MGAASKKEQEKKNIIKEHTYRGVASLILKG